MSLVTGVLYGLLLLVVGSAGLTLFAYWIYKRDSRQKKDDDRAS